MAFPPVRSSQWAEENIDECIEDLSALVQRDLEAEPVIEEGKVSGEIEAPETWGDVESGYWGVTCKTPGCRTEVPFYRQNCPGCDEFAWRHVYPDIE